MPEPAEKAFERITQEFFDKMSAVVCTPQEFRDGLRSTQDDIAAEIQSSLETEEDDNG